MQIWKSLIYILIVNFAFAGVLSMGTTEARQPNKKKITKVKLISASTPKTKAKAKKQANSIVGEVVDTDTMPIEDEESSPDAIVVPTQKPRININSSVLAQENIKNRKRNKKQEIIFEGFNQAEKFHMNWHNFPSTKIKSSHENLLKFCKIACTKKHCTDKDVANKCHLMCPTITTKQCPDPLREATQDIDYEEVTIGNDLSSHDIEPSQNVTIRDDGHPSKEMSPLEQAEKNIDDVEGEEW